MHHAVTLDTVAIGKLTVAVDALTKRQEDHEAVCGRRWAAAIVLLIANLLAMLGGMSLLLLKAWHLTT